MTSHHVQTQFLTLVPRIERYARFTFRALRCAVRREDAVQECLALAWKWFVRLHERGKNIETFFIRFVGVVAKAVKSGRRLTGRVKAQDVLSECCQARHDFKVKSLPVSSRVSYEQLYTQPRGQTMRDALAERLCDNTRTPVPEQVAFRVDWPLFLSSLTLRDQRMAEFLALGHSGKYAAEKFGVSCSRVTQLRQQWCQEWQHLEDEGVSV